MCGRRLAMLLCALIGSACGGAGGADPAGDAGPDGGGRYAQAVALLQEWAMHYDRQAAATCPCLVALGGFPSAEECMVALGTGPTWVECPAMFAAQSDAGYLLDEAQCAIDQLDARASCFEEAACEPEAFAACNDLQAEQQAQAACPVATEALTVGVLEACPDLGLLSR